MCRGHLARPPTEFGNTTRSAGEKEQASKKRWQTTGTQEPDISIIKRVQEIADKKDWKMSQVALAWINRNITSPIIGFSSVDRMDEAIAVRGKTLTQDEIEYLEELYEPKAVVGHT